MERSIADAMLEETPEAGQENSKVERLVALGRRQGYVTYDDILHEPGSLGSDAEQYDVILAALFNARVSVVEAENISDETAAMPGSSNPPFKRGISQTDLDPASADVDDLVGLYLKDAASLPLLTQEQERSLFLRVERGRLAREELGQRKVTPERQEALQRLVQDGWSAREHLIQANTRLVISVAKRYLGRGVPFLDLIQEGNIGLMRSLMKYDPHRGYKFSTYATWWIRQAVSRAIADQGRTIRIPSHMVDKLSKFFRTTRQLTQELQRSPTEEELAKRMELDVIDIQRLLKWSRLPFSLEKPIGHDTDTTFGELIEDVRALDPDESASQNLLREHIGEILSSLPPREARVLELRYGVLDGEVHTLQEVGRKLGVSRERVRQIEATAMRRLRASLEVRKLRSFIEYL